MDMLTAFRNGPAKAGVNLRFLLLCFILGAIAGTTGDFVHVYTHTTSYPADGPFPFLPFLPVKMPIWVPPLFGSAMVIMGFFQKLFAPAFKPRMAGNITFCYLTPVIFVWLYALTGIIQLGVGGWQDIWIACAAIAFWYIADRTWQGAFLAFCNAIGGTLFEMNLVHQGGFNYYPEHTNFFGVASWLPWLYAAASVTVCMFIRTPLMSNTIPLLSPSPRSVRDDTKGDDKPVNSQRSVLVWFLL